MTQIAEIVYVGEADVAATLDIPSVNSGQALAAGFGAGKTLSAETIAEQQCWNEWLAAHEIDECLSERSHEPWV